MGIQVTLEGLHARLCINGDIYKEHAQILNAVIKERVSAGFRSICVNMEGVYYIDCKSLFLLGSLQTKLERTGVLLIFEHARDWQERIAVLCDRCDKVPELMQMSSCENY